VFFVLFCLLLSSIHDYLLSLFVLVQLFFLWHLVECSVVDCIHYSSFCDKKEIVWVWVGSLVDLRVFWQGLNVLITVQTK